MLEDFVKVATVADLADGEMIAVAAGAEKILLARAKGEYFAIGNVCSHFHAYLSEGELFPEECEVQCPMHEARFSLRTGEAMEPPAEEPVETYAVKLEGDDILVGPQP